MSLLLIVDTALVILIWLVQLIIYPVFEYMNAEDLKQWHRVYVPRITLIVAPLMILQLVLYVVAFEWEWRSITSIVFLMGIWINTFLQAVPLHGKIFAQTGEAIAPAVQQLLRVNWIRTILWSLLWILHFFQ